MPNAAILLTAGKGSRMQGEVSDKTLCLLKGKPVILYSLDAFIKSSIIDQYIIVYRDDEQHEKLKELIESTNNRIKINWVKGGEERQDSVFNALSALNKDSQYIFIHDCARPLVDASILPKLLKLTQECKAATLAHPVTDTIKQTENSKPEPKNSNLKHIDRTLLWAMETPQVFEREVIKSSYQYITDNNMKITDDTSAVTECGHTVSLLQSPHPNPKITTPQDLAYIEFLIQHKNQKY